jgi:hypothetical protein
MNEQTGANEPAGGASWRRYPHLEAAIESDTAAILANMEQTRTELERLSRTGTAREQARALAALVAYGRALELYRSLADRRDQLLQTSSNTA